MVAEAERNDNLRSLEYQIELAIADGADIADLQAILAEQMEVEFLDGEPVVVTEEEGDDGAASGKRFKSIMERAGGDPQKALELADWLLMLRQKAHEKAEDIAEIADRQREQIHAWQERETKRALSKVDWIDYLLEKHLRENHPDPKDEVSGPHGRVRWAKQRTKIEWDEEAALEAALAREDVDEVAPRKLSKSALKGKLAKNGLRYLDESGQVVDFVRDVEPEFAYLPEIKQ